jgi:hypothetical protein
VKWLTDILTGPDNVTHDPINYVAIIGFLVGICLSVAHYVMHGVFDVASYMTGYGIGVAALGAAIFARDGRPK